MLERPVRILAVVLSVIVAMGFILFVVDDAGRASSVQIEKIDDPDAADPTSEGERERERRNSKGREYIDDANDVLLKPFAGVAESSDSRWMQRGIPALIGLLLYGFALGYLARFARGRG